MNIGFTGDLAFVKHFENKSNVISVRIQNILESNDYNIMNLEGPIFLRGHESNMFHHANHPKTIAELKQMRCDIVCLSNNHIMDYKKEGLDSTINFLNKNLIKYVGTVNDNGNLDTLILEKNDIKIGILNVSYIEEDNGFIAYDTNIQMIRNAINNMQKNVDWIIMIYHGEDEFSTTPMPYTRKKLKKFLSYGIDIIVAHHPHVIQGYERLGEKTIFYSLGNFIFDTDYQRRHNGTDQGILLNMSFQKDKYSFNYNLIKIDRINQKIDSSNSINHGFYQINNEWKTMWKTEALKKIQREELNFPNRHIVFRLIRMLKQFILNPKSRALYIGAYLSSKKSV